MAEDYTYPPVTDVTTLAARVAELETALREQCELAATLMQQRTELEARLNATGFALANSALIQRVRELEAQLNAAIVGRAELERENEVLTREVAGLRYYIAQLERNVTQEERAYAAGVASLMVSQQAVQP